MRLIYAVTFLSVFLILIFYGCAASVIDMNAKTEFPQGRKLYLSKCSACHRIFPKEKFEPEGWTVELNKMQKRAAISDFEKEQIFLFLSENESVSSSKKN